MFVKNASLACALLALVACQSSKTETESENTPLESTDPHSYARPEIASATHLDLDLNVDFETQILSGSATWQVAPEHGDTIIFDVYDLNISAIETDGKPAKYTLGAKDEILGQALKIALPENTKSIFIKYQTTPGARALQWLAPEQTAGKNAPFLFTQSQAILARTWLPCQDGPGMRYTYNAKITVPNTMLALMSAKNPLAKNDSGVYRFEMEIPIPSYLMALAVGDIESREISSRCAIYAEPAMLSKAAWEFAQTEEMIVAAEAIYGPYEWGRYDVLVLPPSFPFGGMENPRLTFATPTVITGDRSLVSLVAHELAHSWSGNLVTNATWNDFWLNEGFTTYFEMRIMEAVYGRDFSEMLATISHLDMVAEVQELMAEDSTKTILKMNMKGEDPDDGVGAIAYDKGYHFLRLCEETIGRERWDKFVKQYFAANKFKSMNTEQFMEIITHDLLTTEEANKIGVRQWIYDAGLPENCPVPHSTRYDAVTAQVKDLEATQAIPAKVIADKWSSLEWVYFLRSLPAATPLATLQKLDAAYDLSNSTNAEVMMVWTLLVLEQPKFYKTGGTTDFAQVLENFLVQVGRRKFLTPIYKSLISHGYKDLATKIYTKARPNYHSVSTQTIDKVLDYKS